MANIDAGLVRGPQGPQGIKGDPFTYADFTESQITELQRPATDAATRADKATEDAQAAIAEVKATEAKLYPAAENTLKGKAKDTFIHVDDAFPSSLLGIEVEGACKQDGTPSPDNPVPIEVVEHPVVMLTGRNLLNPENVAAGSPDIYSVDGGMLTVKRRDGRGWDYVPASTALSAGTYCISGDNIEVRDESNNTIINYGSGNLTLERDSRLKIKVGTAEHSYPYVSKAQIERGGMASDYAHYTSQSLAFTLPAEHPYLAKLPDGTADEIVVDKDGNVELVARVVKYVATGDESLFYNDAADEFYITGTPIAGGAGYSPELPFVPTTQHTFGFSTSDSGALYMSVPGVVTSYDSAVAWLKSIRPSFYGNIATPITYNLGKIEMRKAQDSIVNVWTDAEITPRTGIEYTRDVNIVVANLESAIASITQG